MDEKERGPQFPERARSLSEGGMIGGGSGSPPSSSSGGDDRGGAGGVFSTTGGDDRDRDHGNRPRRTLVVYSGPTSMDRMRDKNGMYHDNMAYFLEHGISCSDGDDDDDDDEPPPPEDSNNDAHRHRDGDDADNADHADHQPEPVVVDYAFVLTREVADHYAGPDGLLARKMRECGDRRRGRGENPFIRVVTRLDRCYDMESIRTVVTTMDVRASYDDLLFVNCGLVGPKFGPGSPRLVPSSSSSSSSRARTKNGDGGGSPKRPPPTIMVPFSHWSQIYTSRLTDSVRMVGHSINTHFHTFFPHVQSFLYAIRTDTIPILLSSGAIYDCGLTQEELGSNLEKRFELINRYEVGMSTALLQRGHMIATAFVNRYGFGESLAYDSGSTWGTEIDDTVSDIWYEDGIRNLTATMSGPKRRWWKKEADGGNNDGGSNSLRGGGSGDEKDTFEYHRWDILPWDYFVFFKVSRLVPEDVQREMQYNATELEMFDVPVVANDPRRSPSEYWRRKTGAISDRRHSHFSYVVLLGFLVFLGLSVRRKHVFLRMTRSLSPWSWLGQMVLKRKWRKTSHGHVT